MKKGIQIFFLLILVVLSFSLYSCSNNKGSMDGMTGNSSDSKLFKYKQESVVDAKPIDKYAEFFQGKGVFTVPGLNNNFIPQSITYHYGTNKFFIIGYFSDGNPSAIFIIDKTSGLMEKEIFLKNIDGTDYKGHAGGIATDENNIFIANNEKVLVIPISAINISPESSTIAINKEIDVPVNASYCNFSQGLLWVGEFELAEEDYNTDESHKNGEYTAWTIGYRIENEALIPEIVVGTPQKVQGFVATENEYIISVSYGRKNTAYLHAFSKDSAKSNVKINGENVPYVTLANRTKELVCPPMTEGITVVSDKLYVVFESATNKYYMKASIFYRAKCPLDEVWEVELK